MEFLTHARVETAKAQGGSFKLVTLVPNTVEPLISVALNFGVQVH